MKRLLRRPGAPDSHFSHCPHGFCNRSGPTLKIVNDSAFFAFVAEALHISLIELGYDNQVVPEFVPDDKHSVYIIMTTHEDHSLPPRYVAYNFEQLTTNKKWPERLFNRFRAAEAVWDYSLENIKVLHQHGVHAVHVPLGYARNMENTMPPTMSRDIDIFFLGGINERRKRILQPLEDFQGLKRLYTKYAFVSGMSLDEMYQRVKLSINLHYYDGRTILEVHRIIPLIANRIWVLSERSNDTWMDMTFGTMVDYIEPAELKSKCREVLSQKDLKSEVERRYRHLLSCCRYSFYLLPAAKALYAGLAAKD